MSVSRIQIQIFFKGSGDISEDISKNNSSLPINFEFELQNVTEKIPRKEEREREEREREREVSGGDHSHSLSQSSVISHHVSRGIQHGDVAT